MDLKQEKNIFEQACKEGNLSQISSSLDTNPSLINEQTLTNNLPPLFQAIAFENLKAVDLLLQRGADPNLTLDTLKSPLHQSVENSLYGISRLLLKYKANPNSQDEQGLTPLHTSALKGDTNMLELLLKHKSDPNLPNTEGQIPLHIVALNENEEAVQLLLLHKSNKFHLDNNGEPPFSASERIENLLKQFDAEENNLTSLEVTMDMANSSEKESEIRFEASLYNISSTEIQHGKLFYWLERLGLERYFENLIENGFDNLNEMVEEMKTPVPITIGELQSIGIDKAGHRYKMLIMLDDEAGIGEQIRYKNVYTKNSVFSCSKNPFEEVGRLEEWLEIAGLEEVKEPLELAGYDVELILMEAESAYRFTEFVLKEEIEIYICSLRKRLMRHISDTLNNPKYVLTNGPIEPRKNCEYCLLL